MEGWIKIHRKIQSHWVFDNPEYFKAWITILLEVNHAPGKVLIKSTLLDVQPGSAVKSLDTWATLFGPWWTKQKVRTFLSLLADDEMINTQNERITTRLSVCNYGKYQTQQHASNTQDNTLATRQQHASNTQATPNKNEENVDNAKNEEKKDGFSFCDMIPFLSTKTGGTFIRYKEGWQGVHGELIANTDGVDLAAVFAWAKDNYNGTIDSPRFFVESTWPKIWAAYNKPVEY